MTVFSNLTIGKTVESLNTVLASFSTEAIVFCQLSAIYHLKTGESLNTVFASQFFLLKRRTHRA
jgi:hypothetical protein